MWGERTDLDAGDGFFGLHHARVLGRLSLADDLRRPQVVGSEEDAFDQYCRFVHHDCGRGTARPAKWAPWPRHQRRWKKKQINKEGISRDDSSSAASTAGGCYRKTDETSCGFELVGRKKDGQLVVGVMHCDAVVRLLAWLSGSVD